VKTFRIILLTTACVGLGLPASRADFVTVGTPNGGTRDPLLNPGTSRFQQVYSASVFGNVPILITGVAFVSNADSSFVCPGEASMWHTPRFPERILVSLRDRVPTGSRRSSHRRRFAAFRLERLEERTVLSPLFVTSSANSGPGTLRDTIALASSGATIYFELPKNVHTITLKSELDIDKSLDIEGLGPNKLTISGNDASRVFDIGPDATAVTIAGMTITDGLANGNSPLRASTGGGILNRGSLTLFNDVLSNNQALGQISSSNLIGRAIGGGVANLGPTLNVTACQLINNQARGADFSSGGEQGTLAGSGASGAIGNPPSLISGVTDRVSVTDSLFAGNVARGGSGWTGMNAGMGLGGSISNGGELSVTGSIFTANQAIGGNYNTGSADEGGGGGLGVGGAISSGAFGETVQSLVVSGSIFDHNQAVGGNGNGGDRPNIGAGGAISVLKGSGNISNCTPDHNLALGGQGAAGSSGGDGLGGGIANFFGGPTLTVTGTTVDHNKARGGHGGAGGNGGNGYGGGLYNDTGSTLDLTGATVEYNLALGGGHDGLGIGGGVYSIGTLTPSHVTKVNVIKKNHASTGDDNIFPS